MDINALFSAAKHDCNLYEIVSENVYLFYPFIVIFRYDHFNTYLFYPF